MAVVLLLAAPAVCLARAAGATASCAVVNGTVLGSRPGTMAHVPAASAAECCTHCQGYSGCTVWTWEPGSKKKSATCFLKNSTAGSTTKAAAVSGCVSASDCPSPPPPQQPEVSVHVDTSAALSVADPGFKCWNIDASPNREWEQRDLSDPLLASLGRQSRPGYLRFGGAGNDGLPYALDMSDAGSAGNGCRAKADGGAPARCLNRTWVDNLAGFAKASGAGLVFGLNVVVCGNGSRDGRRPPCDPAEPWDPIEARALIKYLIKANHAVYGFELGNEQNKAYTPPQMAANFKILSDMLVELYPDAATRPKVIGPDVHGFHGDPRTSSAEKPKLEYLKEFALSCAALGVPLHASTHHEYVEVDPDPAAPPTVAQLDITAQVASAVNETLASAAPSVQIWAGEIGPHNGKSVPCDHSTMRWANFADSHWYLDAMAVKAANGYSAFCRQDFVGIDYGMIDCATYAPLPDYYSGILWSALMGRTSLKAASSSPTLRAYAHCSGAAAVGSAASPATAAVTVLLINLDAAMARNVTLSGLSPPGGSGGGGARVEWHLTGPGGAASTKMALNGKLLEATVKGGTEYVLPSLDGRVVPAPAAGGADSGAVVVQMAPASIAFVQLSGSAVGLGACSGAE